VPWHEFWLLWLLLYLILACSSGCPPLAAPLWLPPSGHPRLGYPVLLMVAAYAEVDDVLLGVQVANVGGTEFAESLAADVQQLLVSAPSRSTQVASCVRAP
jgi:hypothetical protein